MQLNNVLLVLLGCFIVITTFLQSQVLMSVITMVLFVLVLVERRARKQGEVQLRREVRGYKGR